MSSQTAQHQWYVARDGQQYGPLSESELQRVIELGQLLPNDLVWREGFADWRPALVVFPQRMPQVSPAPAPSRGQPQRAGRAPVRGQPQHGGQPMARQAHLPRGRQSGDAEGDDLDAPRGGLKKAMIWLLCLAALVGAGWYAYPSRHALIDFVSSLPSRLSGGSSSADVAARPDRKDLDTSPLKGFGADSEAVDTNLQATPLWRVIKREFPDWYAGRVKEAVTLAQQNQNESAVGLHMARALVVLRRQNANHALAASFPLLKAVAASFHNNLERLRKQSPEACFDFISKGEASPVIVTMMQSPGHGYLQAQLTDVFEAIADGRKSPRVYPQPRKADYDALAADLAKRGWSKADLQLFTDERALSSAGPQRVCQMVYDWFGAQLAMSDPDMQLRLLVDSLRPVVAG